MFNQKESSFDIVIRLRADYAYTVTQIEKSNECEVYEVTSKTEKYIFTNNRPTISGRDAEFYAITWKQTGNKITETALRMEIIKALEKHMGYKKLKGPRSMNFRNDDF